MKKIGLQLLIVATLVTGTFLLFSNMEAYFSGLLKRFALHPVEYAGVSFVVLASDIILPVPSSIVMYTNGYVLGIWNGALVSLLALMVGAITGYYIGRGSALAAKAKPGGAGDRLLSRYGPAAIVLTRGIPVMAESVSIVCGYNRMPFKQYFIMSLLGYLPLCLLYAFCGSLGYSQDIFLLSFGCSILVSFAFWMLGKKFLKQEDAKV